MASSTVEGGGESSGQHEVDASRAYDYDSNRGLARVQRSGDGGRPADPFSSGVYRINRRAPAASWKRYFELYGHFHLMVLAPVLFLSYFDSGAHLDCCSDEVLFSPAHRPTLYVMLGLVWSAYAYSLRRARLGPPLLELLCNVALVLGFVLNIATFLHVIITVDPSGALSSANEPLAVLGNGPIAWLLLARLTENHRLYLSEFGGRSYSGVSEQVRRFLTSSFLAQAPVLVLLAAPVVVLLSAILIVVGQSPDSALRVFRDTYHHGLSNLTPECLEVTCQERHYLCTIAARGHGRLVKPLRIGYRRGRVIVCNRQLLVANAFEQVIEERWPRAHQLIRRHYDRLGRRLNRYDRLFDNRWVSDAVYLAMKPAEYLFLAVLYLVDRRPEERIELQYSSGSVSAPPPRTRTPDPLS